MLYFNSNLGVTLFWTGGKALRAGLYARVSTHDEKTLPMQLSTIRDYAKKRSWAVAVTNLRRLDVPHYRAAIAPGSDTGLWTMSRHAVVQQALPNVYFDSLGLPRLSVSSNA